MLVANAKDDIMTPTSNSYLLLQQHHCCLTVTHGTAMTLR
jgi:hypothetical protein